MSSESNIINKLTIELVDNSRQINLNTLKYNTNIIEYINYNNIVASIKKVFDKFKDYDIVIKDKFELDLSDIELFNLESEIAIKLEDLLFQYIETHKLENINSLSYTKNNNSEIVYNEILSVFINYIKKPYTPWEISNFDIDEITLSALQIINKENQYLNYIINVISSNDNAFQRFNNLTYNLDEYYNLIESLIDGLYEQKDFYKSIYSFLRKNKLKGESPNKKYYSDLLRILINKSKNEKTIKGYIYLISLYENNYTNFKEIDSLIDQNIEFLKRNINLAIDKLVKYISLHKNQDLKYALFVLSLKDKHIFDEDSYKKIIMANIDYFRNAYSKMLDYNSLMNNKSIINKQLTNLNKILNSKIEIKEETNINSKTILTTNKNEKDELMIKDFRENIFNSGLVLLNPYIISFFDNLGFLKDRKAFISTDCKIRAVHLLQEIVCPHKENHEHLLYLNKIICGLDVLFPIDKSFTIQEKEIKEINTLLKAVIKKWEFIKNTSINGFRNSFLMRNGIIEKSEKDWIVRVESKGLDIILEYIPWQFNILSFPWNEYFIYVDWKY